MARNNAPNFSLFLGGPLFQLLMRLRLTTPTLSLLRKRIVFITLFAWLPLLILSLIDGKAWGGVKVPFLFDCEVQARFLMALPLLIAAELPVHTRLRQIVEQFIDQEVISEKELPRFRELISSAMKLRNSVAIELILLLLAFVGGHYFWNRVTIMEKLVSGASSWYATQDGTLTLAGYWYMFVSRPLFQFIVYRWYFRLFIWARFLWQSSQLELKLIPTHPDHAAGLGFLGLSCSAFIPLALAHGVLSAGLIANSIFFAGAKLPDFLIFVASFVLFLLALVLGPLLIFAPHLRRVKRAGLRDYGILASSYVTAFDSKWVRGGAAADEKLLGSSDIQSLADIANSFQVIRNLQTFPFNRGTAIPLIIFTLIPVLPLVLTMIPLEELIKKFFQAIF